MKARYILMLLTVLAILSSCEKEPIQRTVADFYVSFNLDGTTVELRNTGFGENLGGNPNSTIVDVDDLNTRVKMNLNFGKDIVQEADYLALIGQKIKIGACVGAASDCDMSANLNYLNTNSNLDLVSFGINNSFPNDYIKINAVTPYTDFDTAIKSYVLEGEFALQLTQNGSNAVNQTATNGKFRLLFSERM